MKEKMNNKKIKFEPALFEKKWPHFAKASRGKQE
jgi:hypothetical protein